ncbi:uncharacterized protein LOC143053768 [Mytilus galloprovincialis]|uniref:uncharacterized protein LOC143053768 n=1 Tax=Mytilus galloprovincialis TaxID=29158 RepID=UPI003F7B9A9F
MERDGSIMTDFIPQSPNKRTECEYCQFCLRSLQCYFNCPLVKYVLHNLKHEYMLSCNDQDKCINGTCCTLCQICADSLCDKLYKSKAKPHNCQRSFNTDSAKLNDWQTEISSQILHAYCHINLYDQQVIHKSCPLEGELSSSTKHDGISQDEYGMLLPDIIKLPLDQDPSFHEDEKRLKRARMDSCINKDTTKLCDIYTKLSEIESKLSLIEGVTKHDRAETEKTFHEIQKSNAEIGKRVNDLIENVAILKTSYEQLNGMTTHMDKDTSRQKERGAFLDDLQCNANRSQYRCRWSNEEDTPNFVNVQNIRELHMTVEQKSNATFTVFSPGSNVQVGTIVMGNQNITLTSVDQVSQVTSYSNTMH